MFLNILIHKYSETVVLLVSQMKLIERKKNMGQTQILESYEIKTMKFHGQKGGAETIPSCLVIPSLLKKST